MLAFSVIKLENFRALHKNSIELARHGSPSPRHHPSAFRTPKASPLAAEPGKRRSCHGPRPGASLASRPGISNRERHLLEHLLTYRKQRTASRSNRELSTNQCPGNSHAPIAPPRSLTGSARASFANGSVSLKTCLPGSAQYVESDVTYSKQTTAPFLPGATTTHGCLPVSYPKQVLLHVGNAVSGRICRA